MPSLGDLIFVSETILKPIFVNAFVNSDRSRTDLLFSAKNNQIGLFLSQNRSAVIQDIFDKIISGIKGGMFAQVAVFRIWLKIDDLKFFS